MESPVIIEQLCASVVSTARGVRGRPIYVGWTTDGLPAAATSADELGDAARAAYAAFRASGLTPRRIPYAAVVPASYVLTGPAVDFADTAERRAEDQVRYTVADAKGERREIALGERGVLGGIASSREPWQATFAAGEARHAVDAVPLYTVFAPLPGARADTGVALLFEPTIPGASNEPAMRSFVRNTVGRLLVLDESQPAASRKGYLEAAGRVAGSAPEGGTLRTLVWLRRMGLIEFDDNWLHRLQTARKRATGQFIRMLRGIGMVEVDDAMMEELTHPRPDYDIDRLQIDKLFDLADEMYAIARDALA